MRERKRGQSRPRRPQIWKNAETPVRPPQLIMSEAIVCEPEPAAGAGKARGNASALPFVPKVSLLTGCQDKPYALGLAAALTAQEIPIDFIGSDQISGPEVRSNPFARFLNLR